MKCWNCKQESEELGRMGRCRSCIGQAQLKAWGEYRVPWEQIIKTKEDLEDLFNG